MQSVHRELWNTGLDLLIEITGGGTGQVWTLDTNGGVGVTFSSVH